MIVEQRFQLFQLTFPKQLSRLRFWQRHQCCARNLKVWKAAANDTASSKAVRPDGGQDQILCQDAEPMRGLASHRVISTWLFAFV